jgi:hypothetical protein
VLESGRPAAGRPGIRSVAAEPEGATILVGSGRYVFEAGWK